MAVRVRHGRWLTLAWVLARRFGLPGLVYGIAAADIAISARGFHESPAARSARATPNSCCRC